MTPREELETLAARVEAAEGADRELEVSIFSALNPGCSKRWAQSFAPSVAASLDAAMALVPEGDYFVTVIRDPAGVSYAAVAAHPADTGPPCRTPALALCAAALRARASALTGYGEKGE